MRKYQNLSQLVKNKRAVENKAEFANLLIDDLKYAICLIYGETTDEELITLAELKIQEQSIKLINSFFQQHIEFMVIGDIINDQYPALTYSVNATSFRFYGRCSTIPQICGVDLYLDNSYTGKLGDHVKQKFSVPVNKLYRSLE